MMMERSGEFECTALASCESNLAKEAGAFLGGGSVPVLPGTSYSDEGRGRPEKNGESPQMDRPVMTAAAASLILVVVVLMAVALGLDAAAGAMVSGGKTFAHRRRGMEKAAHKRSALSSRSWTLWWSSPYCSQ